MDGVRILGAIANTQLGRQAGSFVDVPASARGVTLVADMDPTQLHDATNVLRLVLRVKVRGARDWLEVVGSRWQGGAAQTPPSVAWQFNTTDPEFIGGDLVNGVEGDGSKAAVKGLYLQFNF